MKTSYYRGFLAIAIIFLHLSNASAIRAVPGDLDADKTISSDELARSEEMFRQGKISADKLEAIRHIHDNYPRTVVDTRGREVTIYQPVKTVVCTISHHMETLRTLKIPFDTVVGGPENVDIYSIFPEFKDIQTVGSFYEPDVEKILELNPDLVLVHPGSGTGMFGTYIEPLLDKLEGAGLIVACFACSRPECYPDEVKKLGALFEKEDEAESFVLFYQGILDSIEKRIASIPEGDRPVVYSENRKYRASENDVAPIEAAGGRSIFAGMGEIEEVNPEDVVAANPDIIIRIMGDEDYDRRKATDTAKMEETRAEIMSRPELANTTAVRNGKVYLVASPLWTYMPFSGCRHFIGVAYLAKWFHPDLFNDLDPQAIHQRYLTEFQGLEFDLRYRGILVYPKEP